MHNDSLYAALWTKSAPLAERVSQFGKELADWQKAGRLRRTKEERSACLTICEACPLYSAGRCLASMRLYRCCEGLAGYLALPFGDAEVVII